MLQVEIRSQGKGCRSSGFYERILQICGRMTGYPETIRPPPKKNKNLKECPLTGRGVPGPRFRWPDNWAAPRRDRSGDRYPIFVPYFVP